LLLLLQPDGRTLDPALLDGQKDLRVMQPRSRVARDLRNAHARHHLGDLPFPDQNDLVVDDRPDGLLG